MAKKMLSTEQAAQMAGVSRQWIAELIRRGEIPAERYIKYWLIDVDDFNAWLEQHQARQGASKDKRQ